MRRGKSLGDRATQRLIGLVNSCEVTLAPIDRDEDSYGRKLRIVKVDGESVGETLVEDGALVSGRAKAVVLMGAAERR